MRKVKLFAAAALAAAVVVGGATADARPRRASAGAYGECIHGRGTGYTDRWDCCQYAGGAWVEVYNPDGSLNKDKSYCDINGTPMPDGTSSSEPEPSPTPAPGPRGYGGGYGYGYTFEQQP